MDADVATPAVVLTRHQCLDRLRETPVGRIGLSVGALPVILPIHFTLMGDSILFPTSKGSTLARAATGAVVAFQADAYDDEAAGWWSVLLQGVARPVDHQVESQRALMVNSPWATETTELLVVGTDNLGGRFFCGPCIASPSSKG